MSTKKPLGIRIVIWICIVFMVVSLIWVYVVYMFSPKQEAGENIQWDDTVAENATKENIILPEIDPENPENSWAPILVTEDWEIDEMDQTVEVQLENWETELVRQWDLSDVIQINQ